jgi:hypothetical protein
MVRMRLVMAVTAWAPVRSRFWGAMGVLALWTLAVAPALLGLQPCPFARLLRVPCPGCGLTRAIQFLLAGRVEASLRMHPLAIPLVAAVGALALSTVTAALTRGSPADFYRTPHGRAALVFFGLAYVAAIGLWGLRFFGAFGGPVPV